jgi:hypothetical protein
MTDIKLSIDTHAYDGKLVDIVKTIKEKFNSDVTFEESINDIVKLCDEINYSRKLEVHLCLRLFINDKNSNHDNTNQVNVEDILPRLWTIVKKWDKDGKEVVLEQLADVVHGSCAQGRTTRLIQLFPL